MMKSFFLGKTAIVLVALVFAVNSYAMGKKRTPEALTKFSTLDFQGEKILGEIGASTWIAEKAFADHSETLGDNHIVYEQILQTFSVSGQRLTFESGTIYSCLDCMPPLFDNLFIPYDSGDGSSSIFKLQQQNGSNLRIALGFNTGKKIQLLHLNPAIFGIDRYDRNNGGLYNSSVDGQYEFIILELDEPAGKLTILGYPSADSTVPETLNYRVKGPSNP